MQTDATLSSDTVIGNYPLYIDPLRHAQYLARYELFKRILHLEGCILECGVAWGGGLIAWQHFSWLYEPHNLTRKVYGFDVFDDDNSFPSRAPIDGTIDDTFESNQEHLQDTINQFAAQFAGHIVKTYLVKGDACETIPAWCTEKPHALVALLYLDFDVYLPTKTALEWIVPRMPRGGIIAFDEVNYGKWPGETRALMDTLGVGNVRLQRFPFSQTMAYVELGA